MVLFEPKLRSINYGFNTRKCLEDKITHLFYLDDLKLYASNSNQLQSHTELVNTFSKSIKMQFGLSNCAVYMSNKGK